MARFWLPAFSAALVIAADTAWKSKQIPQWDENDVMQILADSPWAKTFAAVRLPELTEAQRREGGATGGGKGDGLKALEGITLMSRGGLPQQPVTSSAQEVVTLRWESALPVRVAEMKAREFGDPDWQGDEYVLGVYEVPDLNADQKSLPGELKSLATLKRDGKKDLKPSRVDVLEQANGRAMVFYLFPRNAGITREDNRIEFVAQIRRLYVACYFYTLEMQFQGKLEL
jgi:hypothetical protein